MSLEKPKISLETAAILTLKGAIASIRIDRPLQTEVLTTTYPTQKAGKNMLVLDANTEIVQVFDKDGNLVI